MRVPRWRHARYERLQEQQQLGRRERVDTAFARRPRSQRCWFRGRQSGTCEFGTRRPHGLELRSSASVRKARRSTESLPAGE